jgi:hypothetical protein
LLLLLLLIQSLCCIWGQFRQRFTSFHVRRSEKLKKDSQVVSIFYTFGICTRKSCAQNVDEIDSPAIIKIIVEFKTA